jgi:hypothetical protein
MKLDVGQMTDIYMSLASDETRRLDMLVTVNQSDGLSPNDSAMRTIACTPERWKLVGAVTVAGLREGWMSVDQALHPRAFDWVEMLQTAEADPGMYGQLSGVYQQLMGVTLQPGLIEEVKDDLSGLEHDVIVLMGACEGACSIAYEVNSPDWEGCVRRCRGPR